MSCHLESDLPGNGEQNENIAPTIFDFFFVPVTL